MILRAGQRVLHVPGMGVRVSSRAVSAGGEGLAYLVFNGTTANVNCGSDASLDDLHNAALTVEAWVRADTTDSWRVFASKGLWSFKGWHVWVSGLAVGARVWASTATYSVSTASMTLSQWAHVAMTYDNGGDRKHRLYVDGVLRSTSGAASGTIVSDAAQSMTIGKSNETSSFNGAIGWMRLSNSIRYSGSFTPAARDAPPAVDGNTVEQWNLDEGVGLTAAAQVSSPTNDGTITAATWSTA